MLAGAKESTLYITVNEFSRLSLPMITLLQHTQHQKRAKEQEKLWCPPCLQVQKRAYRTPSVTRNQTLNLTGTTRLALADTNRRMTILLDAQATQWQ